MFTRGPRLRPCMLFFHVCPIDNGGHTHIVESDMKKAGAGVCKKRAFLSFLPVFYISLSLSLSLSLSRYFRPGSRSHSLQEPCGFFFLLVSPWQSCLCAFFFDSLFNRNFFPSTRRFSSSSSRAFFFCYLIYIHSRPFDTQMYPASLSPYLSFVPLSITS